MYLLSYDSSSLRIGKGFENEGGRKKMEETCGEGITVLSAQNYH